MAKPIRSIPIDTTANQRILSLVKYLVFGLVLMATLIFTVVERSNHNRQQSDNRIIVYHDTIEKNLLLMLESLEELRVNMYREELNKNKIEYKNKIDYSEISIKEKLAAAAHVTNQRYHDVSSIHREFGDAYYDSAISRLTKNTEKFIRYAEISSKSRAKPSIQKTENAMFPLIASARQIEALLELDSEVVRHHLVEKRITDRYAVLLVLAIFIAAIIILVRKIFYEIRGALSDRDKIFSELIRKEDSLAEAQSMANVGNWEWIIASGEIKWSAEIYSIFGYEPNEVEPTYEAFLSAIHEDDRGLVEVEINRAIEQPDDSYEVEHRVIRPDGDTRIVAEKGRVYSGANGKPIRMVGTVQDITEQKLASAELEYSQARFKAIFNSITDAVVVADTSRNMAILNEAALDQFGYSEEELLGNPTSILYANQEDFSQTGTQHYNVGVKNSEKAYEVEYARKDGSKFWGETLGARIESSDDEVFGFVGIIRDVTDRKNSEKELEKHRENLEELVFERTQELVNTQAELVRKERLATLGQLTATVSHELRNPLGAMRPSLYIVQKTTDPENKKLQQAVERLDRNISRCDHIIDELLDFTRITILETDDVVVDDWVRRLIDEQAIPDGFKLIQDLKLDGFEFSIDTHRLRRALINIIDNGFQAMQEEVSRSANVKHPELTIFTRDQGGQIEIGVRDRGLGITDDVLPHVFEPLFSTKGFGVGLGMPTVKQIVEQHGGSIDISSEVGIGTTVRVIFPKNRKKTAQGLQS